MDDIRILELSTQKRKPYLTTAEGSNLICGGKCKGLLRLIMVSAIFLSSFRQERRIFLQTYLGYM